MPGRQVLMVDDDAVGGESLTALLRRRGLNAEWAVNAESALVKMRLGQVRALVVDHYLPGIDGLALLRKLRASPDWHDLPVVVLTAAAAPEAAAIERELAGLQPATLVRKPAGVDEVLRALESLPLPHREGRP